MAIVKKTMLCTYDEGGVSIEKDKVGIKDARAWFKDSYAYHTGEEPTARQEEDFMNGLSVGKDYGSFTGTWNCIDLGK